jgi:hypothetical protein
MPVKVEKFEGLLLIWHSDKPHKMKQLKKNGTMPKMITIFIVLIQFLPALVFAQQDSAKKQLMKQLLDFSRPGNNHEILNKLAGTWNFKDARLTFVKGTLIRKPIYDGRFYSVEVTGGKLQVPVADGKMKEEPYQSMQIEGYDNPRMKFVTMCINNHIGSDIQVQTGTYDLPTHSFTFDWDSELVPGMKKKNKRVLKVIDNTHYIEEFYEQQNGKDVKVRELDYEKTSE